MLNCLPRKINSSSSDSTMRDLQKRSLFPGLVYHRDQSRSLREECRCRKEPITPSTTPSEKLSSTMKAFSVQGKISVYSMSNRIRSHSKREALWEHDSTIR